MLIFETKNELIRLGVTESKADHLFDIDRIIAQAFENFLLLFQLRLGFRQPTTTQRLLLAQTIVLLSRIPKIQSRRRADGEEKQEVNTHDDATKIHNV